MSKYGPVQRLFECCQTTLAGPKDVYIVSVVLLFVMLSLRDFLFFSFIITIIINSRDVRVNIMRHTRRARLHNIHGELLKKKKNPHDDLHRNDCKVLENRRRHNTLCRIRIFARHKNTYLPTYIVLFYGPYVFFFSLQIITSTHDNYYYYVGRR